MSELRDLLRAVPQRGRVVWIGLRPARRAPPEVVSDAFAEVGRGLRGDRYDSDGGARQVTLLQAEHLPAIAALAGHREVDPALLRRNLVVAGIPLLALKGLRFEIGDAVFEGAVDCAPCSRMEEALGPGGYHAMRGHGGITARVVREGTIRIGDPVVIAPADAAPAPPSEPDA